jgi:hypothetical protein
MHFIERIPVMRKFIIFLLVASVSFWASYAHAALSFNADFNQNGTPETSWTMKADDVVAVDIYVSSVPAPGLVAMGFKLTYDPVRLSVQSASIDQTNWNGGGSADTSQSGEIDIDGFRTEATSLSGNNILLATVTFQCLSEGTSEIMLLDREGDWFVLENYTILDGDIGTGVLLATIIDSFNLTVSRSGTGTGKVTSSPSGINCGSSCIESYASGTTVVLTATPTGGSSFVKWTGCNTANKTTCTVIMTGNRSVNAEFEEFPWVMFIPAFTKKR